MRVPLQWLADYVDLDLPTDELAHRLTMTGLKVEKIDHIGHDWNDVIIGAIVEIHPHPSSRNPLHVASVNVGDRTVTIVTGAQNLRLGDRVPVVLVGAILPHGPDGEPMEIQARPMAGITSEGMLASARELGISDEHSGIYVLPGDAPVGEPLRNVLGGDVLDIETNPNRPDTLSIIGIAREVAAITNQQLTLPSLEAPDQNVELLREQSISVEIHAPELCPRYSALRIEGTFPHASPYWMASRLEAAGMRPISLLVDITNYVMLEYGQPMHAFDAEQLRGDRIVIRRAEQNERLVTLDGVDRALMSSDLVIADGERAVAVAGVMGGESTEISSNSTSIILESANFEPVGVRKTAQSLGLRTEASSRFEKGLPPEQTVIGVRRYLQLLAQITDGPLRAAMVSDVCTGPLLEETVTMPLHDLRRLLGVSISSETAAESLSLLGFEVAIEGDVLVASVPYWRRVDIRESADLVEEIARLVGFDTIPSTLPHRTVAPTALPDGWRWTHLARRELLTAGASETVTDALTSPENMLRLCPPSANGNVNAGLPVWKGLVPNAAAVEAQGAHIEPLPLLNPLTKDRQVLRLTLLPGVLDVVSRNLRHTEDHLVFFEIARTYFPRVDDLPFERRTLAIAMSGNRRPRSWQNANPGPFTFYDIKGLLESVLQVMHTENWAVLPGKHPAFHPGRVADLVVGGREIGHFGELHPQVAAAFEIEGQTVQAAELDFDALFSSGSVRRHFETLPRYPVARRDIAAIVDDTLPAARILEVIHRVGDQVLERAEIFDVYTGDPLPQGKKSIAVALDFRSPHTTLTQEEVGTVMRGIVESLCQELGVTLRD